MCVTGAYTNNNIHQSKRIRAESTAISAATMQIVKHTNIHSFPLFLSISLCNCKHSTKMKYRPQRIAENEKWMWKAIRLLTGLNAVILDICFHFLVIFPLKGAAKKNNNDESLKMTRKKYNIFCENSVPYSTWNTICTHYTCILKFVKLYCTRTKMKMK